MEWSTTETLIPLLLIYFFLHCFVPSIFCRKEHLGIETVLLGYSYGNTHDDVTAIVKKAEIEQVFLPALFF
ncbi:hypothetical protein CWS01_09465 [Niallia nealsonii]|uniref:Uncharacterized protein n=1 Tax=Niallia nealsonii TaxID=115979 RepID=A0A2N0Z394_9BACI|nr:hypothetical protein CWS01_09465 [Niallia nealsonii]